MMKTLSKWIRMAAALMLGTLMFACTGNKQPSTEFSAYIKAYTGGVVPGNATIRIEFLSSLGANQNAEGLLSFTPSIKGQARWASNNLLEFIPEEGELKPGKAYNACLRLDKLTKVSSELKKFEFSFAVAPKQLDLTAENIRITAADPDMAAVSGTLRFSSDIPSDKVSEVIKWEYPASAGELKVNPSTEANAYSSRSPGSRGQTPATPSRSPQTQSTSDTQRQTRKKLPSLKRAASESLPQSSTKMPSHPWTSSSASLSTLTSPLTVSSPLPMSAGTSTRRTPTG